MKIVYAKIGTLFALLALTSLSAWPKPPVSKSGEAPATVIAHVPGFSADVMLLLDYGDERYLYTARGSNAEFAIVNVSNPTVSKFTRT